MNNSLISVIIPVYNGEEYIAEAIDSALNQTYKELEIIVVDDGSKDKTREIVNSYCVTRHASSVKDFTPNAIRTTHDAIRPTPNVYYIYQSNKGPAAARNAGIKIAKGEYVAFLDADDVWLKDKLENQLKEMTDGIGMVGVAKRGENTERTRNISYKDLLIKNRFCNSGVMVKRECFDKVGLFDERPEFKAVEDWDMWIRIAMNYKTRYLNLPLIKVRVTQNSISSAKNAQKMLYSELCVLQKNFSEDSLRSKWLLRLKAYSYCHYRASIAYREVKSTIEARKHIFKAVLLYPFNFLNKIRLSFAANAILGLYR